jgi:predicted ABC-type sugar transport system permease subunit
MAQHQDLCDATCIFNLLILYLILFGFSAPVDLNEENHSSVGRRLAVEASTVRRLQPD